MCTPPETQDAIAGNPPGLPGDGVLTFRDQCHLILTQLSQATRALKKLPEDAVLCVNMENYFHTPER